MGCETKQKGDVSEAAVLCELVKLGFAVLQPFGDNWPYDLVVEVDGCFWRLQCKTGKLSDKGVIGFSTVSTLPRFNGSYDYRSYEGEADYFAVYCPQNNKVYIVPVDQMPKGKGSLRVDPTKNNQSKGVVWAEDYILSETSFRPMVA